MGPSVALEYAALGHPHDAPDPRTASAFYADPSRVRIMARAGEDKRGGWIAGVLVGGVTVADVHALRRCSLSGDWRVMSQSWWSARGVRRANAAAMPAELVGVALVVSPAHQIRVAAVQLARSLGPVPARVDGTDLQMARRAVAEVETRSSLAIGELHTLVAGQRVVTTWQASMVARAESERDQARRERDAARRELAAVLGLTGKLTMLGFRRVAASGPVEPPIGSPGCTCRP